jgi:2,3,4,5-tetrahydropyridine-2-carboxylate N-succinyltransferase
MYFPIQKNGNLGSRIFEYHDKMLLKKDYAEKSSCSSVHLHDGSFISSGVIMMPSYVNIGAYVDAGTMVDTWATVGSCAQIGKDALSGGGIGGFRAITSSSCNY